MGINNWGPLMIGRHPAVIQPIFGSNAAPRVPISGLACFPTKQTDDKQKPFPEDQVIGIPKAQQAWLRSAGYPSTEGAGN